MMMRFEFLGERDINLLNKDNKNVVVGRNYDERLCYKIPKGIMVRALVL